LFEIQEEQLLAASGRARCSHCDNIFNARKHLTQYKVKEKPTEESKPPQNGRGALSLSELFDGIDLERADFPAPDTHIQSGDAKTIEAPSSKSGQTTKSALKPQVSDSSTPELDSNPVDLPGEQAFAAILERSGSDSAFPDPSGIEPDEATLSQIHQRSTDIESETPQLFVSDTTEPIHKAGHGWQSFLWSVAILCLLVTALAQSIWYSRDRLEGYPEVRELLELVCAKAGCTLPPWREPGRFNISSRSVRTHPNSNQALQIQLVFSNTARFAQPFPNLQLQLYDTNETLSAQRVFHPDEYLSESRAGESLIKPAQSVEVDIALEDPGDSITGFKIEFL